MEQSGKNIHFNELAIADIDRINIEVIARGDYSLAYRNMCEALERRFDTGLHHWRRGESPVPHMEAALATSREMLTAITAWKLDDETLNGYGDVWNLVSYMSFLLGQPIKLPDERLAGVRKDRSRNADLELDYRILDALAGCERREGLQESFDRLAAKKRQLLAEKSYRTYFALLEEGGDGTETEGLVLRAEANYARRAKDAFYSGGPTYMGGGPDNPYVVDFTLAAILKKIGWAGESIHKWRWDVA